MEGWTQIPTISLCGMGNTCGCHGKAHGAKLYFRWRDGWEYIRLEEPTRREVAMVQEEAMRVDLKTIKRHCHDTGCGDCALDNGGCMFRVPPEQWRLEVMELAILKIATDKARKAIDGRMAE